jgi:signal transduction histidine kinase
MHIVLDNLVGNAFKYTSKKPSARIEIGSEGTAGGAQVFFIRDDGAGFDASRADRMFTPFARMHGMDEFPGIGIGLATVQRIIDRHGGRVWAKSAVGSGATFYFTLGEHSNQG